MDKGLDNRLLLILEGLHEDGPEEAFDSKNLDSAAETISREWNIPIESVVAVKYLAEHGPYYDEMIDNYWNAAYDLRPDYDPNEEIDETICIYYCSGYECEPDSHDKTCPYILAVELLKEWSRQQ